MSLRGELHLTVNGEARTIALESSKFTIGRGPENSLCLPVSVVSRLHAELIRLGQDFILRDLGSTNGSFINGSRITELMLSDGDHIRFGSNGPEMSFRMIENESGQVIALAPPKNVTTSLMDSLIQKVEGVQTDVCEEANARQLLAEAFLNKGSHDRALEALTKYNDTTNLIALPVPSRASILLWVGRVYLERKQLEPAIDALSRSLNYYQQTGEGKGDDTGLAAVHASLGRALLNKGELLSARDHLHRAMLNSRRAGNVRWRAEAHYLLGKVDWKEGDFEGARYNWGRAARMSEESGDALLEARVQLQQALVLYTEGKLKEAIPAYQSAIERISLTGNIRLLLKAYSSLSRVLARLGSWRAMDKLLDDRLQLAQAYNLLKAEAVALTDLAELRLLRGDLIAARQSIEQAVQIHGKTIYARTQRILGRVLQASRRMPEAMEAFEKGLAAARETGAIEEQVLIGFELAVMHAETGDTLRAFQQLEAAEAATSLDPALNLMARALYTRGQIHAAANQPNEASRCFSQSLSIFQTIGDQFRTALSHAAIGELRLNQRRPESARAHLEEARTLFAKLGAMAEMRRVEARLTSGTLFDVRPAMTVTLPALGGTAQLSLSRQSLTGSLITAPLPGVQRVLVAVTSDELATILQRGLEVENFFVDRIQNGREALERALQSSGNSAQGYQLLLLDALLEYKSGFDICRELRKSKRETPIILLGGRQGVEDKIEALQAGADDFLSKRNLVFEELLAKIEALLR
ncbi:MAG TPA: tetratricopeptide repeat protein [Blastocatellia bacterium]